jgi:hypothetical protein
MKVLDTPFYYMNRQGTDTFVYAGLLEFTAEEVNYVGVGMGMAHFHLLQPVPTSVLVEGWNIMMYGHGASFGELSWANYGVEDYARVTR